MFPLTLLLVFLLSSFVPLFILYFISSHFSTPPFLDTTSFLLSTFYSPLPATHMLSFLPVPIFIFFFRTCFLHPPAISHFCLAFFNRPLLPFTFLRFSPLFSPPIIPVSLLPSFLPPSFPHFASPFPSFLSPVNGIDSLYFLPSFLPLHKFINLPTICLPLPATPRSPRYVLFVAFPSPFPLCALLLTMPPSAWCSLFRTRFQPTRLLSLSAPRQAVSFVVMGFEMIQIVLS